MRLQYCKGVIQWFLIPEQRFWTPLCWRSCHGKKDGTYGYKITQDVRKAIDVSESTLYPVLRRLQKDECLEVYDMQFDGRNRRYYKVTEKGMAQLNLYKIEWKNYSKKIRDIFEGGVAE